MRTERDDTSGSTGAGSVSTLPHRLAAAVTGALVVALAALLVMWLAGATTGTDTPTTRERGFSGETDPRGIDLAALTESSTHTTIEDAPGDPGPPAPTDGAIVHPRKVMAIYDAPGGAAIAKVGPTQIGDTWFPVIGKREGWVRVLLPSKPNGSSGWLRERSLDLAFTPYLIRIHLGSMRLQLYRDGREVGNWVIGKGVPSSPTPVGRTFLLGSFVDPDQDFSPVILPLGAHSPTLDTFGGGPGTVAIHTWPTTDVLGKASSNGCVRVPHDALDRLTDVPLGTLVLIDKQ